MEEKLQKAAELYRMMADVFEEAELVFQREDENLLIRLTMHGEDIPVSLIFKIDAEREVIRAFSPLPFDMNEDKRLEGAVITCEATNRLSVGCFEYDLSDGSILFRMTTPYHGSTITKEHFLLLLAIMTATMDKYNDRFLAVNKGVMSLEDFLNTK